MYKRSGSANDETQHQIEKIDLVEKSGGSRLRLTLVGLPEKYDVTPVPETKGNESSYTVLKPEQSASRIVDMGAALAGAEVSVVGNPSSARTRDLIVKKKV